MNRSVDSRWARPVLIGVLVLIMLSMLLGTPQPVSARPAAEGEITRYVSTTGSDDSNDCAAPETPCLTINHAIGQSVNGDTIKVAVGTYTAASGTEVVLINKSITLSGGWDEAFETQIDRSTIDGEGTRGGVRTYGSISNKVVAIMENFIVENGYSNAEAGGISNNSSSTLTINNSVIRKNVTLGSGGGITNLGTMTVNNTTIDENIAGNDKLAGGGGGAGIQNRGGTLTLNSSTVSNNTLLGGYQGSGILTSGSLIVNNSAISSNAGGNGAGIYFSGVNKTVVLSNSTITQNKGFGIYIGSGTLVLRNTIVAKNGVGGDCYRSTFSSFAVIISEGYNLIGNGASCSFTPSTGDIVGTNTNPIDPKIGPLLDNGGATFTHALFSNSPARNAGNPALPGSGESTCLMTDQRGVEREEQDRCDIGAFEGYVTVVSSIKRLDVNPTDAANVNFIVLFSEPVTGVSMDDFFLTTVDASDASVQEVSGSGAIYNVTVNTGSWDKSGTIRLDVIDNDDILDVSENPLGGQGLGNGDFTSGEVYTVSHTPGTKSPKDIIITTTPVFKWSRLLRATEYQLQVFKGTKMVYSKIVPQKSCKSTDCAHTSAKTLAFGNNYKWRVRAKVNGEWKVFSPFMAFKVSAAKPGMWVSKGIKFYVTNTTPKVDRFAVDVYVGGCGLYRITRTKPVEIKGNKFSFSGTYYASGTFATPTSVSGSVGFMNYSLPGCGNISGGPFSWVAKWKSTAQPKSAKGGVDIFPQNLPLPEGESPFNLFEVEPSE